MKKSFLLCLLMTLFTTWAVQAAELTELTVHDGTAINSNVPMYVFYFDDFTRSQTVFPAEELADMKNESILSMKFYTSYEYAYTTAATVDIYLKEVEDAKISEFVDKDEATIVYQGTLDFVLEGGMATVTIEFTTPFQYNGGNLMFGCDNTTDPEYKGINFYGETVTDASIAGYNSSSLDNVSPSQKNFIPKTTFTYGTAPTCLKPTNLTVSGVTHNSATFDWTSDATQWQLNINGDDSGYISEKPYTTYMFNPLTTYTVKVRAVCGSDYSEWSNPITFSTSAIAEEVGNNWSDDFEGTSCGWSLVNGTLTNAWAWGTAANNGGTHALYISNDGGETNAYTKNSETMVFATKLLAFEDGEYEFSYDWLCNGEGTVGSSCYDYLRVALVPASVQLVAGTSVPSGFTVSALPSGWIALDGDYGLLKATEWQSKTVSKNNITAGNYYLVLAWRDDTSGGEDHPAAVDNVNIHKVTCSFDANAANLSVSNITTTSATLNWNNISGVSAWNFAASLESTFPDDDEKTVTGTIPALITSFTIPNALIQGFTLQPGTTYYVKMRAACGTDDFGSWSNVLSFTTECEAITDATWSENFDDIAIASTYTPSVQTLPNCWKSINNTTYSTNGVYPTVYYYSYTDYSHSTPNMLRFYSSYSTYTDYDPQDQYAILPAMEDLSNKQIVFWAKAGASTSIQVGTIEDVNDASTFVKMETLELTTGYQEYIVSLAGSSEKHIAIMMEAADENNTIKSVYVDDITVEDLPECPKPMSLAVSNITAHNATFTWTGESDLGWQLCLNDGGDDEYYNVSANPFTISADLKPETEYTAKLRTLCEDDAHSDWSSTITFTTDVACPAPTNLEVELTPGDGKVASLQWEAGSAENWILQYSESAAFEPAQEINVTGNAFHDFDDLMPETTYYARVKAVCGGEDGESQWSSVISFTPTNAYSMTINEGTATNTVVPIQGVWVDNLTRSQFIIPASELASIAYANITQLTFYASEANVNEWFADAEFEVYVAEVGETTISALADWASMENVLTGAHFAVVDHEMVVTFDQSYQYMGGNLMIGFYQTVSGTYKTATWYGISATGASYGGHEGSLSQQNFLPKMTINYIPGEAPTCFKPTNLQVMGIDNHNAYLSWVSDADAWHLCLDGDEENFITRTDPMYAWNGLEANTEHSFKVRSVCGDEVTAWSEEVTFTTLCDPISDLYEFFETYTDWELPACWHGIYESTYPTVAIGYSEYAYSGSNFLYFYSASDASTDQYAILPNIESLDGKRIKFYARKQEATWEDVTMTVGVMTDPSNENTFVALESFTLTSTEYDLYNVSFADYTGEGKFIAIKMDAAETDYAVLIIDDITVNDMPSCLEPTGLTFTEITGESATLIWESDAEAWRVYLEGPEEDAEIVYEKSYTFTGLDPMTQYTAVVHAICSEEESSAGSYINFTTDCGVATLPFFEGFEGNVDCWTLDANGSSSGLKNTASYEGDISFAFSYPYYQQYLISPELEVTDNDVNVEFYYAIQSASYPETFQVGYSTSSNDVEDDSWVWSDEIEATNVFSDHWEVYSATLPAGVKYFGIKYNSNDMYYLYIDNISLEEVEPQDECEAQALPFNEDFEENSETLECWTTVAAAEDTEWAWDDQNNHFFRFYFGDEPQYLISPELVPEDMNARIAFDYKCGDSNLPETFKLGYSYYGNSLDEFEWTDELLAEDAENWTQFACVVPGGVTYIAIQYTSIDQFALLIDNISVTATDKPTSVEALKNDAKAYKFVKDGNLFILHNGKLFNAQGKFVK